MPKLTDEMAKKASDAEDGFKMPDPGKYRAKLTECELHEGQNAPYLRWTWQLVDHTARVWDNTSMSDAAIWTVKRAFSALGADLTTDTDELIGSEVILTLSHRDYNGKVQLDVQDIEPLSDEQVDAIADAAPAEAAEGPF